MRRALGLEGGAARPRTPDRHDPQQRQMERFVQGHNGSGHNGSGHNGSGHSGPGHNGHKRRFVQDGEVPVTVVSSRRDGPAEMTPHRGPSAGGGPSRLEAAEHALAHETSLRQQVERALAEAQATVHDLQTKLGHAELARVEAAEHLRREQETSGALRAELRACEERLRAAEADRVGRPRRERFMPHSMDVVDALDTADTAGTEAPRDAVAAARPQPARRGRPAGKKPAQRSKLVRWWIKDEPRAD